MAPSTPDTAAIRRRLLTVAVAACFTAPAWAAGPTALPSGATNLVGVSNLAYEANKLTITTAAARSSADWDKFSIPTGMRVDIFQPSAASAMLNRVISANPSQIYGTLWSNGQVWLVNQAGIQVGPGGMVDTAGFIASTLNVNPADFLAGKLNFLATPGAGDVVNQGTITTPSGGFVYLVGANVSNEGIIHTPQGETLLAAGQTVNLVDTGTPGVKVEITGAEGKATNLGTITAEAGRIGIAGVLVKNSGALNASSVVSEGGRIFLKASGDAYVEGDSRIEATGTKGGRVEVLGDRVAVTDNALIDASGANGGGTILVGGDYQGRNPDIQNARFTELGQQASIHADATDSGNGGKVILWADNTTRASGKISARGAGAKGKGGFVETSGKQKLFVDGMRVDTRGPGGLGTWLLDPASFTVAHLSGGDITDTTINTNLQSNNVVVNSAGDIVFADDTVAIAFPVSYSYGSLTFSAGGDIYLRGSITNNNYNVSPFSSVTLDAGGRVITPLGANLTLDGTYQLNVEVANGKTWDNYGTINLNGKSVIDLDTGAPSTFHNKSTGVVNIASTQGFAFQSNANDTGVVVNDGTINVSAGTAFEVAYSQGSGGKLAIDGVTLSLQNAGTIQGEIDLQPSTFAGILWISENHGGAAYFNGTTFTSGHGGTLFVGGSVGTPTANFNNVDARSIGINLGHVSGTGQVNIQGKTVFDWLFFNGSNPGTLTFSDGGYLASISDLTLATGNIASASGQFGILSAGHLTLGDNISTCCKALLAAGWDGNFSTLNYNSAAVSGAYDLTLNANVSAANEVKLLAGGVISQNVANTITTPTLRAMALSGDINLLADNQVTDLYLQAGADINFKAASSYHARSVASTSGAASIYLTTAVGSGGDIALGTVNANTGSVDIAADGAIYDDNGSAVNITADSVFLTSNGGGNAGGYAISADIYNTNSVVASVTNTASQGGIRVGNSGNTLTSIDFDDQAAAGNRISLSTTGDLNLGGTTSFITAHGGDIFIKADHDLGYGGGTLTSTTGTGSILLSAGNNLTVSALLAKNETLGLTAGNTLSINSAVSQLSTGDILLAGSTINIFNDVAASNSGAILLAGNTINLNKSVTAGDIGIIAGSLVGNGGGNTNTAYLQATAGDIVGVFTQDVRLNNGANFNASLGDVKLTFLGGKSTLYLNDSATAYASRSYINASPDTIHLHFAGRSSGGVVIDGVESQTTLAGRSGFFTGASIPLLKGAGLEITYGVTGLDSGVVNAILKSLDTDAGTLPEAPGFGASGSQLAANDHTTGGGEGEFGEKKDREENGNHQGDEHGGDKGGKHVGQCS